MNKSQIQKRTSYSHEGHSTGRKSWTEELEQVKADDEEHQEFVPAKLSSSGKDVSYLDSKVVGEDENEVASSGKGSCLRYLTVFRCWRKPDRSSSTESKSLGGSSHKSSHPVKTKKVETGYLKKDKVLKYNKTMAMIRIDSYPVLEKQHFDRHSKMNKEGFLIENRKKGFFDLDSIFETSEADQNEGVLDDTLLVNINYVLQLRLDEVIAVPKKPVDGYNEALIELTRLEHSTFPPRSTIGQSDPSRTSLFRSSSSYSIRSKIHKEANSTSVLFSMRKSMDTNFTRNLLSVGIPLLLALLPTVSREVHFELLNDHDYCAGHAKHLEEVFRKQEVRTKDKQKLKKLFSSERFMAVIYIDYRRKNPIEAFRRLVVQLILHKYLIAFEEKDLSREAVSKEFVRRLGHYARAKDLPFVFTRGAAIGGCSMMYYLNHNDQMDKFFKHSINRWILPSIINGSTTLSKTSSKSNSYLEYHCLPSRWCMAS